MARKTRKKVAVSATVRVKPYEMIRDAVTSGIAWGISRARKYSDEPTDEQLADQLELEIMNALSDVLDYGDGY